MISKSYLFLRTLRSAEQKINCNCFLFYWITELNDKAQILADFWESGKVVRVEGVIVWCKELFKGALGHV